jgi:endonuclease III
MKNTPPQAPAPPPDPLVALQTQLQALQAQPTWEDAVNLMRQDGPRGFRIDIETDSTISGDLLAEQQGMTELLNGVTQFMAGIGPAVESGLVPVEVAKDLLLAAVRRFRMGKQIEDSIDQIGEKGGTPSADKPDPKQAEIDFKHKNLEFQIQQAQADSAQKAHQGALEQQNMQSRAQIDAQRLAFDREKLQAEMRKSEMEHQRHLTDIGLKHQRESQALNLDQLTAAHDMAHQNASHQLERLKAAGEHMRAMLDHATTVIPQTMAAVDHHVEGTSHRLHAATADATKHMHEQISGLLEHAAKTMHRPGKRYTITRGKDGKATGFVVEEGSAA